MSATSFGGSFGLVKSDDSRLKNLFVNQMKRVLIDGQLPFLKYLPFIPTPADEIKKIGDEVIERRRAWKGPPKKDLVQILLDANTDDPASYTKDHIRGEMQLFM
jgi:cytochrome P450